MAEERTGVITFKGKPFTLLGKEVKVGDQAPDFTLIKNDLSEAKLSDYSGKTLLVSVVPSLDTGVCSTQTKRFNEEAGNLPAEVQVLTVSADLPFAQARWCGASDAKNIQTLSDYRGLAFGEAYGVIIKELHLLTRSIFVIGADGKVEYTEIVSEVTQEPDYDKALSALKSTAGV